MESRSPRDSSPGPIRRNPAISRRQGIYWLLTIPRVDWEPTLPDGICYVKGQAERGDNTGYEHWQLIAVCTRKQSIHGIKRLFGIIGMHGKLTYNEGASNYVWKEDTYIEGTRFELGQTPFKRNDPKDWEKIWTACTEGKILEIPADVRVLHYSNICRISANYCKPVATERTVFVFCGPPGTGKSRRAWDEAGLDAYPKDPTSKFWDSYQGEEHVVIDEFRGGVDVSDLFRWLDRYPVRVQIKGSACVLRATKIWITSNLHPRHWYPTMDPFTLGALERRINIVEFENSSE